ncbi:uncharacterized protein METZ01_LOCUS401127, partial [marine metagenome]
IGFIIIWIAVAIYLHDLSNGMLTKAEFQKAKKRLVG